MNSSDSAERPGKARAGRLCPALIVRVFVTFAGAAAAMFFCAGRLDWVMAWVYLGLLAAYTVTGMVNLVRVSPDLMDERRNAFKHKDVKWWDKLLLLAMAVGFPLGILVVAGLDERWAWSATVPPAIRVAALGLALAAILLMHWAMTTNRFFSAVIRIQTDRGHQVVDSGPYRYVRHPGYAGGILFYAATPLILGSLYALIGAFVLTCLVILRAALEERILKKELTGYEEYARRVRWRLLPGIW